MDTARITGILTDPVTVDLVERQPIMQIGYAAPDGSPRAVPIGYLLREGKFLAFTIPTSDKVAALRRDPTGSSTGARAAMPWLVAKVGRLTRRQACCAGGRLSRDESG
jgi:hypothetical protein